MDRVEIRLTVELVPSTCWYTNVRSTTGRRQWGSGDPEYSPVVELAR
jgi:hypothetical protein